MTQEVEVEKEVMTKVEEKVKKVLAPAGKQLAQVREPCFAGPQNISELVFSNGRVLSEGGACPTGWRCLHRQ